MLSATNHLHLHGGIWASFMGSICTNGGNSLFRDSRSLRHKHATGELHPSYKLPVLPYHPLPLSHVELEGVNKGIQRTQTGRAL